MSADLPFLLGEVRTLTDRYKAGSSDSFEAFRALLTLLLGYTILAPHGAVRLHRGPAGYALGGWDGPQDPLPLNDGRDLRLSVALYLADTPHGPRLKVKDAGYQYQSDRDGERWIFRYDYLRHPPAPHPAAHLQLHARLEEADCLPPGRPLERIHFPTHRVSIEMVIRLLADQFGVPCHEPPEIWRPVLDESERRFLEIAHPPLPGAAA